MYESFFGLTGLPFQLNPDPTFLFLGKGHEDAFAASQKGLAAGARVIVVTGEVGAGKTTLLQALLATVDPLSTVTAHISASGLDAEMLTDRLCGSLGQPLLPDPLARRDALLARLRSGPLTTLLVIDEAQHLEASAFELLETLADAGLTAPARLQICLVGQPELRILLNAAERSGFRKLVDVDRHLRPLEQTEIRLYVEHRLHRAGWTGRPEFEDAAFFEIFVFTAGLPRRVNLLCNSLMLSAWLKRQERIDAPAVTKAAAAIRGDSFQGAPDLPDVEPHFNDPPTLTEALEPEVSATSGADRDNPDLWSCSNCNTYNATSASECSSCEAARPGLVGTVGSQSDAFHQSQGDASAGAVSTAPTVVQSDGKTAALGIDDLPPPTISDGTSPNDSAESQPINAPSAGVVRSDERTPRRRRQAIVAGVASLAVAAAAIVYVVDQRIFRTSRSQIELPSVVVKRTAAPAAVGPALDPTAPSTSPLRAGASSSVPTSPPPSPELANPPVRSGIEKAKQSQNRTRLWPAEEAPNAAAALTDLPTGANPAASGSGTPRSCSDPASALGLCDAEISSSNRRQ